MPTPMVTRRHFLCSAGLTAVAGVTCHPAVGREAANRPRKVAAVMTEFRPNSHAEVIAGRWLEGFELDGQSARPRSELVALFIDQLPDKDMGRKLADKHQVPVYRTIAEALCRGGSELAVDGVLLIGEHGHYALNEKKQKLYPRRRFFEETVKVFRAGGRVVPVFCDKHLSYSWEHAKWMYDRAAELKIPFMAGSSLPTAWRKPAVELASGSEMGEALVVAYGDLEAYGFHALEMLQCLAERRAGGEKGVSAVTCVEGPDVWKAAEDGRWSRPLLDGMRAAAPQVMKKGKPEDHCKSPAAFLVEYRDGCRGTVLLLNGYARGWLFGARMTRPAEEVVIEFRLQDGRPYGHFTMLVQGIDAMFHSGKPTWPVERTLLTTGILDAAMTSRFERHRRLETSHLAVSYRPGPAWQAPPLPRTGPRLQE